MVHSAQTSTNPSPMERINTFRAGPDENGHFGIFGGRYVAETLMPLVLELERAYTKAKADDLFQTESRRHSRRSADARRRR